MLKNPRIIILDEATSAIDSETELLIQGALDTILAGKTAFIVAHRLSTIRKADRILYISDKGIAEEGAFPPSARQTASSTSPIKASPKRVRTKSSWRAAAATTPSICANDLTLRPKGSTMSGKNDKEAKIYGRMYARLLLLQQQLLLAEAKIYGRMYARLLFLQQQLFLAR